MKLFFRIACLALLLSATLAQDLGFDLADALDDDSTPPKPTPPPKKDGDFGFDLNDALGGGEDPFPPKPPVVEPPPSGGGGGGTFNTDDLVNIGEGGNYEPDGGRVPNPGYDSNNRATDQPQDPDFDWAAVLKTLNTKLPEDFFMWVSSIRKKMAPLLERVLDLLNALPGDEQQEL